MALLVFGLGLASLIAGAEALVRGASRSAAVLGISPVVIGLTVVAFGTSAPELAVGVNAALSDQADLVVGNVVGSNIFNVLLILGVSALLLPLAVSNRLVRLDVPLMIGLSVLVLILCLDGAIARSDGLLLIVGLAIYVSLFIYQGLRGRAELNEERPDTPNGRRLARRGWATNVGSVLGGLVLLTFGSRWLVDSAVSFARHLGVSELVVGLTITAAGTSLPELVTSVVASVRGERDVAVGNIVGSNIFNIMGVLGLAGVVAPTGIHISTAVIGFDVPVMIVVALACLPIFFTGGVISRKEGALLVAYYVAYTLYLVLAASHHDALPRFSAVMLYFAIPLTLVTILVLALREIRTRSRSVSD